MTLFSCDRKSETKEFFFFENDSDFVGELGYTQYSAFDHTYNGSKMFWKDGFGGSTKFFISDLLTGVTDSIQAIPDSFSELTEWQQSLSSFYTSALMSDGSELIRWSHVIATEYDRLQIETERKYLLTLIKDGETVWELDLSETIMKDELKAASKIRVSDDGTIFVLF